MPDPTTTDPDFTSALGQVTHQVLAMKRAGDLEALTERIWRVLEELQFDFVSCAFLLMDAQRDWLISCNIWEEQRLAAFAPHRNVRPLGDGLCMLTGQVPLSAPPRHYQDAVVAWRRQSVERHVLSQAEIAELVELARNQYAADLDIADYAIRFHLYVPFEYGVFTLRTTHRDPDQLSAAQVDFLRHLVEIVSVGYGRCREFLRMERERGAQQVRAEVQAMEASDDIMGVMGILWQELRRAGLDINYMTISVRDLEKDLIHLYAVQGDRYRDVTRRVWPESPSRQPDIVPGADFYRYQIPGPLWDAHHTEYTGILQVGEDEVRDYYERIKLLYGLEQWPEELFVPMVGMAVGFPRGRLLVTHTEFAPQNSAITFTFTPQDLEVLEGFAEALGLGFTRLFDIQRLEQRKRELEVEGAVVRVQNAVQSMKTSADIVPVILLLSEELLRVGLDFYMCSVNLVDREAGYVRMYGVARAEFVSRWAAMQAVLSPSVSFGPDALDRLVHQEGPVFIRDIPGAEAQQIQYASAPLDSYHGRIQEIDATTVVSRTEAEAEEITEEYKRRWKLAEFPRELWTRSVLRTPFSGGTIAISDTHPDHFTAEDARILERFAEAFSLGYARHLDFRRLERQNRELEAANRRVQAATRHKSEFIARMSHDLRTPMNAIIGYTRIILRKARDQLDARQLRNLENIDISAHNLLGQINAILDLSRIEAGRIDVRPEEVDLERLVVECAASVAPLVKPDVALEQRIDAPPVWRTDPEILRTILMNLLSNAVKFTAQGCITVTIRRTDHHVELSVADTGVGIPPEDLPRIFEEFHQVQRESHAPSQGTGLGLAIAKRSVQLLGGTLSVESREDEGSAFTVVLPLRPSLQS